MNNLGYTYQIKISLLFVYLSTQLASNRSETTMSKFTAVQDMSNTSVILKSLQEIGHYFSQVCHDCMSSKRSHTNSKAVSISELSVSDEVYKNVVDVLHPIANYLQTKAQDSQKEKLSNMLAINSEIIDHLCEGILYPFIEGNLILGWAPEIAD